MPRTQLINRPWATGPLAERVNWAAGGIKRLHGDGIPARLTTADFRDKTTVYAPAMKRDPRVIGSGRLVVRYEEGKPPLLAFTPRADVMHPRQLVQTEHHVQPSGEGVTLHGSGSLRSGMIFRIGSLVDFEQLTTGDLRYPKAPMTLQDHLWHRYGHRQRWARIGSQFIGVIGYARKHIPGIDHVVYVLHKAPWNNDEELRVEYRPLSQKRLTVEPQDMPIILEQPAAADIDDEMQQRIDRAPSVYRAMGAHSLAMQEVTAVYGAYWYLLGNWARPYQAIDLTTKADREAITTRLTLAHRLFQISREHYHEAGWRGFGERVRVFIGQIEETIENDLVYVGGFPKFELEPTEVM